MPLVYYNLLPILLKGENYKLCIIFFTEYNAQLFKMLMHNIELS